MDSLIGTDPKLLFAFWLGVAVTVMTLIMLAVIIIMRQVVLRRERIHDSAVALWKTVLVDTPNAAVRTPELQTRDLSGFVQVWNEVHEPMQGRTTENLSKIAREVGLEQKLYRRMVKGGFHDRLLTIIALGHVRTSESFRKVAPFLDNKSPIMSLCAARSLMQIDSAQAVSKFVPQIVQRSDWSQGSIATILQEAGDASVTKELAEATLQANVEIAPRLIRFLAGVSPTAAAPIIRKTLISSADERLVSTCLQVMSNAGDLDCVRPLLAHPRWHVRMQAAVTLGRLGVPGDDQRLIAMLSDGQWWVRYRAAQALTRLSFFDKDDLHRIQKAQTDGYARDIISHVLAEKSIGVAT